MPTECLQAKIAALPADDAIRILAAYLDARGQRPPAELGDAGQRAALKATAVSAGATPVAGAGEGHVARAGLAVIATEPQAAAAIESMIDNPPARSFIVAEVAVLTLAVSVLMTSGSLHKGPKGWEFSLKKDALNTDQLKAFLSVVAGWFGKGGH